MGPGVVLAAGALAAAVVYGLRFAARGEKGRIGAGVKTASIGLLVPALALAGQAGGGSWFWLVPLGLALGALGDLCLALKGERLFLAGVAAFGLGHLASAGGFLLRSGELGFDGLSAGEGLALAGLAGLLLSTEVWLAPRTRTLRGPVRGYVALIGMMGLAAVLLPVAAGQGVLRLGAALFILSDLMLAVQMFVSRDQRMRRVLALTLWPAYWGGQALIAWGALVFWGVGPG